MRQIEAKIRHPWDKHSGIVSELRYRLVNGEWLPGQQIPTREELSEAYDTTLPTIQKALRALEEDGFVRSERSRGTFVVDQPPHLSRFGLVFNDNPDWPLRKSFWEQAVRAASREMSHRTGIEFVEYHHITGHIDVEDYDRLRNDVERRRLGGLIFVWPPYWLKDNAFFTPDVVPMACFGSVDIPRVPVVTPDPVGMLRKAMEYARAKGHTRVAVVTDGVEQGRGEDHRAEVRRIAEEYGLDTRRYWIVPASPQVPESARVTTELMLRASEENRPDMLIVMDDHVAEQVTLGVIDAGLRAPEDVEICSHCNYPVLPKVHTPVTFLGFDAREVLEKLLTCVKDFAAASGMPPRMVSARFESELERQKSHKPEPASVALTKGVPANIAY